MTFTCHDAYALYGRDRLTCIGPNLFDNPLPDCRLGCPPIDTSNGRVDYATGERPIAVDTVANGALTTIRHTSNHIHHSPAKMVKSEEKVWTKAFRNEYTEHNLQELSVRL